MADDEIQKEAPEGIQKESPQAELPLRPPPADDANRVRLPDPKLNVMAQAAFGLGVYILMPVCVLFLGQPGPWFQGGTSPGTFCHMIHASLFLHWVLGPADVILGILGVRYRIRHPTARGLGRSIFGIIVGFLITVFLIVFESIIVPLITKELR